LGLHGLGVSYPLQSTPHNSNEGDRGAALDALIYARDVLALEDVLRHHPSLVSEGGEHVDASERWALPLELSRALIRGVSDMLDLCAAGDTAGAWARHESALQELQAFVHGLVCENAVRAFAATSQDSRRAAEIGEELLTRVAQLHAGLEVDVLYNTATAYCHQTSGTRGDDIERACVLLERAAELCRCYPDAVDQGLRVRVLMNLGTATSVRTRGEPLANIGRAVDHWYDVLDLTSKVNEGSVWATAHTELGRGWLALDALSRGGDEDNRPEAVSNAMHHFAEALTFRSFERDPLDWAYTQLNLAVAYERGQGEAAELGLQHAIHCASRAVQGFEAAGNPPLVAWALGNCAIYRTDLAARGSTSRADRDHLLSAAETDARGAIARLGENARGVDAGQRWTQLSRVLAAREGYTPALVSAVRRALRELTPQTAPREAREAGRPLAMLAAAEGEWSVAAEIWEHVALAATAVVESRSTQAGRFKEIADNGNLFRWAAYAVIRAGAPERAVELLELGRARLLSVWLQRDLADLEDARTAAPSLYRRYSELSRRIEVADRQESMAEYADFLEAARLREELAVTVAKIQSKVAGFLRKPRLAELTRGLPAGHMIAYPVTSPWGSVWLLLRHDSDGSAATSVVPLSTLTSGTVVDGLTRGYRPGAASSTSYLTDQVAGGAGLDEEIAYVAAALGSKLMEPLATELRNAECKSVCIVPMGVLGMVPLHALAWKRDGISRCLLDDVEVTYAPSAHVRDICQSRTEARHGITSLVAVGNPLPHSRPLRGAAYEAEAVAAIVPILQQKHDVLINTHATTEAILSKLPKASHVHLACHARAAGHPFGFDGALSLAHDLDLSATEIRDIDLSGARLIVASACETGRLPRAAESTDEALTLSSVFLAAGAAGVVASLWKVDDYSTTLLMLRFYENLAATPERPARALRAAQLWLRDLSPEEEASYVTRHPELRVEHEEWRQTVNGRRGFQAPSTWAAFVFNGV